MKLITHSDKLPIFTDIDTLDTYCEYLLNDSSKYINYANLSNLYDYICRMDPKVLMSSDAKMARYEFIKAYLDARMSKGIVQRRLCLQYVTENVDGKYLKIIQRDILNSIEPDNLKRTDIEFINNMIFAQLNVMFMHQYKPGFVRLTEDLDGGSYGKTPEDCDNAIQFLENLLSELKKAQRRSKQDNRFNLSDTKHFQAIMNEAWDRLLSENNFWQTGMQGLNNMLGGGFENARVYNFIGATGGFKSGLLLNLMKMIKKHNKGRLHKDSKKRPTILFLSQENNIWETILRIFNIFGTIRNIKNFDKDEIMSILEKGGFSLVADDDDIDIEFRYYGNMDIGVPDIRGFYEELDNQGREVVCVLQDYIERLRPPRLDVDKRVQLNDVSNQLHDLAIELDIPIITGSQLNKEGVATVEDMRSADKMDIGKKVGSKHISESFGMLKNFDVNITIVVEYDSKEERYWLSFRRLKFRGDDSDRLDYFCQPFNGKNSKIMLMEDMGIDPLYRRSMMDESSAQTYVDNVNLDDNTRVYGSLTPETPDADDIVITAFADQFNDDIDHADMSIARLKEEQNTYKVLDYKVPIKDLIHNQNVIMHMIPQLKGVNVNGNQ